MPILDQAAADLHRSRTSQKWTSYGPEVLPLFVAEMDSRPCPDVVEAVTAMVSRGDTGYTRSTTALTNAFTAFADREWDWTPDLTDHKVVPDVMIGIGEVIDRLTPHGSGVVVSPPVYAAFFSLLTSLGREAIHAPLTSDFRLDPEALERAFVEAGAGAAYILCSPHNPTGTLHSAEELAIISDLALRHQILVISDEIHAPLTRTGTHFVPWLSVADHGIALHSASKTFNLAALRAAVLLVGPRTRDLVRGMRSFVLHSAQQLAIEAQRAAWASDGSWLAQLRTELDDRAALLSSLVGSRLPGVQAVSGPATYLAWWDCTALGLTDPMTHFLEQAKVATVPGRAFSPDHGQWVRVNYAASPATLTEAVDRIAASL